MSARVRTGRILLAVLGSFLAIWGYAADDRYFDGRPEFKEGWERGYYVWREGSKWHVRWTTQGARLRFGGSVTAEGGKLEDLKRIDVETERRVIRSGRAPHAVVGPRGRVHVRGGRAPVVVTREQDKIEKVGDQRIEFFARTDADIDGFDFEVDERVTRLRFQLQIEGRSRAVDVEVGGENRHPPNNPFEVNLR